MYSVKPKSTTKHDSSPKHRLPAKTGKPPKLRSACSGSSAFGHVVSANWPPDVMPFTHYWSETLSTLTTTLSNNCVRINNWKKVILFGFQQMRSEMYYSQCTHSCLCLDCDSGIYMHFNVLTRILEHILFVESIHNSRLTCCRRLFNC